MVTIIHRDLDRQRYKRWQRFKKHRCKSRGRFLFSWGCSECHSTVAALSIALPNQCAGTMIQSDDIILVLPPEHHPKIKGHKF